MMPTEPTDEARAWAEKVCARMVEVADQKGGPMLDDDVAILASEVLPIMRERDTAIKGGNAQYLRAERAEERARRAEEEVERLKLALKISSDPHPPGTCFMAFEDEQRRRKRAEEGERRWKEIATENARCPECAVRIAFGIGEKKA